MIDFESWLGNILRRFSSEEPTPPCPWCDEPILDGEPTRRMEHLNVVWHRECVARMIVGPVGHLLRRCVHHGGTDACDPPDMSRREAARAAWEVWHAMQSGRMSRGGDA